MSGIICTHNGGFFSCCSVKLYEIVNFINMHRREPETVDSSQQFEWYKNTPGDITFVYFEHYQDKDMLKNNRDLIKYHHDDQFRPFADLDYNHLVPIVAKYFSPSLKIQSLIQKMEQKYSLDYDNLCVLFYRGNDKGRETQLCIYEEYLQYANLILEKNRQISFLIQTDETEFLDFMSRNYPDNSFYFRDEIRHMSRCNNTVDKVFSNQNYDFSQNYLAITVIMSRCKYIICNSGNCSIWIMFYRGNNDNVYQNLDGQWFFDIV